MFVVHLALVKCSFCVVDALVYNSSLDSYLVSQVSKGRAKSVFYGTSTGYFVAAYRAGPPAMITDTITARPSNIFILYSAVDPVQ